MGLTAVTTIRPSRPGTPVHAEASRDIRIPHGVLLEVAVFAFAA